MKDIGKKINTFMLKYGGYSLLIATAATVGFFAVLQWANDYVKEKTGELVINVAEDGTLSVPYNYDDKEKVYILWETDGGCINTNNKTDVFKEQNENKDNRRGYYSYSLSDETASWSPEDADGNVYGTATVRAVLYERDEDNIYKLENYVTEVTVTLTYEDGKVRKTDDRLFSNPVRNNSDGDWSQIYCIEETDEHITYRYRTGQKIDEDDTLILCWQSDKEILSQTDYTKGLIPECGILDENRNVNSIKASTMVTCDKSMLSPDITISAFLVHEETYKSSDIKEEQKLYKAELLNGK